MARLGVAAAVFIVVCLAFVDGGILDSIKSVLGLSSSSSSSAIQVPSGNALPNYFRIEAEIVRMDNNGGLKSNGGACDTVGQCDPVVYAYIDALKPTSPFPGVLSVDLFPKVFAVDDMNSPKINTVVSVDVCNQTLKKATLRVHVMDRNKLFTDSLISDYDCYVGGNVGNSAQDAKWTSTGNCVGKYIPDKIKLIYRTRIFRIEPKECVDTSAALVASATTTAKSFFG